MKKYLAVFLLNLQQEFQRRASLVMERIRSLALVLSLYFLWSSLLEDPTKSFLGYSRTQMLTYVLGLALLRALVLTNRVFELTYEIARGRISAQLMRPMNLFLYQFSLDVSDKAVRCLAAIFEITILALIFKATLYRPENLGTWVLAFAAVAFALVLYFLIGLTLTTSGFWSAESIGFLWATSLLIEFCSGAFFPLDVLPKTIQEVLLQLPFPYLVYFPINIYLERLSASAIIHGLCVQLVWILGFSLTAQILWKKGLATYQAEGG